MRYFHSPIEIASVIYRDGGFARIRLQLAGPGAERLSTLRSRITNRKSRLPTIDIFPAIELSKRALYETTLNNISSRRMCFELRRIRPFIDRASRHAAVNFEVTSQELLEIQAELRSAFEDVYSLRPSEEFRRYKPKISVRKRLGSVQEAQRIVDNLRNSEFRLLSGIVATGLVLHPYLAEEKLVSGTKTPQMIFPFIDSKN